jgi:hypothetical protein
MQEQAANIILGEIGPGDTFVLKYGIFKFRLSIKPLTVRQLIMISRELAKVKDIDENQDMFKGLMDAVADSRHIARAIAIATGTRMKGLVTRAILRLPTKDLNTLFSLVNKQTDPTPFFFIIMLAKGRMNLLNPTKEK